MTDWMRPVPNALTVLRLVAAGLLPFVPASWRLPLIVFAGASDLLDGYVARRFDAVTRWGTLFDGIADKAFVLAALVTFVGAGDATWSQALVVLARDLTVTAIAAYAAVRGAWAAFDEMEARPAGKLTTALVVPWFVSLLLPVLAPLRTPLFVVAALASVAAAVDYALQLRRRTRARAAEGGVPPPERPQG